MALATTAVASAAATTTLAYLNARLHLLKDLTALRTFSKTQAEYAAAAKKQQRSLWYLFEAEAARIPHEPAIWTPETGDLAYEQVYKAACQWGNWLKTDLKLKPGDLLALYMVNSVEMVLAMLGAWAVGVVPSLINYNLTGDALLHCLKMGKPKAVLVDGRPEEGCVERMTSVQQQVKDLGINLIIVDSALVNTLQSSNSARPGDELRVGVKDEDAVVILFTSGTTGFPKGSKYHISRVSPGLRATAIGAGGVVGPNATRWYTCMPMYHGTGFSMAATCLVSGMCVCVGRKFSVSSFWEDVRASRATAFVYVGETARYLLAAPPNPRDKDHNVSLMFGNGLRPDVWNRFRERFGIEKISEFFNSTEGVFATSNTQNRGDFTAAAVGHHGAIIRLLTRNQYIPVQTASDGSIVRDTATGFAQRAPYDVGGEILVRVPSEKLADSGFTGYVDDPSASAKRFVRDVFAPGDCFYRSGDALRRDNDGRWYFLDRLGDTFRWKSENVSTAEVSAAIGRFPGVTEANVYGVLVPDHDGRAGCAAVSFDPDVVTKAGGEGKFVANLLGHLRSVLPKYAVPVFLRQVKAAGPQMHNNKQNKVPLRDEGIDVEKVKQGKTGDVFWWATQDMHGFERFDVDQLESIKGGRARL